MANEFKRMQQLAGLITESEYKESQLSEQEFDLSDEKQWKDFIINHKNELVGKKIKLNIFDTSADNDAEKENYTGDIVVDLQKTKGSTSFATKFVATLIDNGGYKYMAPYKGKDIIISLPPQMGTNGAFNSEDYNIDGTFKIKTLTIL